MYQVIVTLQTSKSIASYTDSIMEYYERLYSDTGLGDAEDIIRKQYRDSASFLNMTLHKTIRNVLWREVIIGYSYNLQTETFIITTSVWSRRVFIEYRENTEGKIRIVTNIQIVYK